MFDKASKDGSGKADCERTEGDGDVVYGGLFRISLSELGELDKAEGRGAGYERVAAYCQDNRVDEASLTAEVKAEILAKAKAMYEEFLTAIAGKKVPLDKSLFELSSPSTDSSAVDAAEEDASADE